eukprot:PhF_6_TR29192/c0_g1_i1/m.42712/K01760/metC; cystathionine beta-lyase
MSGDETTEELYSIIEKLQGRIREYEKLVTLGHIFERSGGVGSSSGGTTSAIDLVREFNDPSSDEARTMTYQKTEDDMSHYKDIPTFPLRPRYDGVKAPPLHPATQVVHFDGCPHDPYHPATMPIYQTATFVQPSASEYGPYDYTRSGNPTRTAVETLVAKLECAYSAFAFTSGMAALTCAVRLLNSGDEVIACSDLYGGMHRLLSQVCNRQGISLRLVDTTNIANVISAITPATRMIHVESPSNPLMRITDLKELATAVHAIRESIIISVDSTMMTPVACQPLFLGCDVVVHSATKFLNGHSDVMAGIVAVKSPELAKQIAFVQNAEGTALAPFDCWLVLRGLKTLSLRVERAQANAEVIVQFLLTQSHFVKKVYHAGTRSDSPILATSKEEAEIHAKQCKGSCTVISFETGDDRLSQRFVDACVLFKITVSFGSCTSLVEMPCTLSHASIPKEKRTLASDLIRLSIGIEDVSDLLIDLQRAIKYALSGAIDVRKMISKEMNASQEFKILILTFYCVRLLVE